MPEYLEMPLFLLYLSCSMNKKMTILGEELTEPLNMRTTKKLKTELLKELDLVGGSLNSLINSIIFDRYFRKQKTSK